MRVWIQGGKLVLYHENVMWNYKIITTTKVQILILLEEILVISPKKENKSDFDIYIKHIKKESII